MGRQWAEGPPDWPGGVRRPSLWAGLVGIPSRWAKGGP